MVEVEVVLSFGGGDYAEEEGLLFVGAHDICFLRENEE